MNYPGYIEFLKAHGIVMKESVINFLHKIIPDEVMCRKFGAHHKDSYLIVVKVAGHIRTRPYWDGEFECLSCRRVFKERPYGGDIYELEGDE